MQFRLQPLERASQPHGNLFLTFDWIWECSELNEHTNLLCAFERKRTGPPFNVGFANQTHSNLFWFLFGMFNDQAVIY